MKNRILLCIVGLAMLASSLTAFTWLPVPPVQSVCTFSDSNLNGPGAQENDLYCMNGTNIAPSTYPEVIALAQTKAIVIGTPKQVGTIHDFHGVLRVDVEFSRGYHAEHYLVFNPKNVVYIYAPYPSWVQLWP